MKGLSPAELVLKNLGVTEPKEIDLEAIAWTLGASIKYRPLDGCEACITGDMERAIITVNSRSSPRRKRFSLGHELGHWKHHRGRILVCRSDDVGGAGKGRPTAEREADGYAADLLLPRYLLKPILREYPKLNFQTIRAVADIFNTSPAASAIRLVETGHAPAVLVCHGPQGRKWFTASLGVPDRWFPQKALDRESSAFSILFGADADDTSPRKIDADAWFDRPEAEKYEVQEQTIRTGDDEILTLILIRDEAMLEEIDSRSGRQRRR